MLTFVIIAALGQLGIQTASLVAIIGAAGLAAGLALQGSLANFAAGVLIILFRPIKAGDFVEIAGVSGSVAEISIFSTTLLTGDNKTVIVANADESILKDKDVAIGVVELGDSSVKFVFRPWVNTADYWGVYFDLNEKIKNRFEEVGIGIPYPTMDLNVTKS